MLPMRPDGRHALLLLVLVVVACRRPDYLPIRDGQAWRFAGVTEVDAVEESEYESLAYAISVAGSATAAGLGRVNEVLITRNDEPYMTFFLRKTKAALFALPASHLDGWEPTSGWVRLLELPLREGALWYGDEARAVSFEVMAREDIAVPAGRFRDCFRIRIHAAAPYAMDFWLAPDEGIVRWNRRLSPSRRELAERIRR
jgi:hypothetical protein